MKINLYNQDGKIIGDVQLSDGVFGLKMSNDLLHQVVVSQASNRRQGTADTKDRAEVRGGGRKPWRQKGTGRARHGSRRSPIWVGGGVTFGPQKERVYAKTIPAKMRKKALLMVLSAKARQDEIIVLDSLQLAQVKTKEMAAIFAGVKKSAGIKKGSILLVLAKKDDIIFKSARNLPSVAIMEARELNALDALSYKYLIMMQDSLIEIEKIFKV